MKVPSLEGGTSDWDTYTPTQVGGVIRNLAKACGQPMAGLISDLKNRGLLDQSLVIWGGEMGRGGNGHMNHNGNAFTWWMAGGGVRAGSVYGATDERDSPRLKILCMSGTCTRRFSGCAASTIANLNRPASVLTTHAKSRQKCWSETMIIRPMLPVELCRRFSRATVRKSWATWKS